MTWLNSNSKALVGTLLALALLGPGTIAPAADRPTLDATLEQGRNGDVEAQYTLGEMYGTGQGVGKDPKRAAFWYTRAAIGGHAEAQYRLGLIHETGDGAPQNYTEALDWYTKAIKQGHSVAKEKADAIYDHIDSVKTSAQNEDPEAQHLLGEMYATGNGVRPDDQEAAAWYRKAADQGHATGQFKLGRLYAEGKGVARDDALAVDLFRKAAEQGQADAQYHLGSMYFRGTGIKQDAVSAYAWLTLAAAQGHQNALQNKPFAADRLTPEQRKQAEAMTAELQAKIKAKKTP